MAIGFGKNKKIAGIPLEDLGVLAGGAAALLGGPFGLLPAAMMYKGYKEHQRDEEETEQQMAAEAEAIGGFDPTFVDPDGNRGITWNGPRMVSGIERDLRPVIGNADGSGSTERSITITDPRVNKGRPTNIPSMWDGEELDQERAIARVLGEGRVYPAFESIDEAETAAFARSEQLGREGLEPGEFSLGPAYFNPAAAKESRLERRNTAARAFPEEARKAAVSAAFATDPTGKDRFLNTDRGVFDVVEQRMVDGTEDGPSAADMVWLDPPDGTTAKPRYMNIRSPAAQTLVERGWGARRPEGTQRDKFRRATAAEVAEAGLPEGTFAQVNETTGKIEVSREPKGPDYAREDYWRGQFKEPLTSAFNAFGQTDKIRNALALESGTGDIAAINALQKMIDEGGVVREQDVNLIQGAQSLYNTLATQMEALKSGGKLSPELRQQITQTAQALSQAIYGGVKQRIAPFAGHMQAQNVSMDAIVPPELQRAYGWIEPPREFVRGRMPGAEGPRGFNGRAAPTGVGTADPELEALLNKYAPPAGR